MGGRYQISSMNVQVVDGHRRQIEFERLPVGPIIQREVHAGFSTGKEQALAFGIFANGADIRSLGNSMHNQRPVLAVVTGAVYQRTEIIELVSIDGDIGRAGIVW